MKEQQCCLHHGGQGGHLQPAAKSCHGMSTFLGSLGPTFQVTDLRRELPWPSEIAIVSMTGEDINKAIRRLSAA